MKEKLVEKRLKELEQLISTMINEGIDIDWIIEVVEETTYVASDEDRSYGPKHR